ncbi:MAG: TIGR04083 family peptide-modifying radical SAM enzyme [Methanomicrobiales archaeon]|nr:TIGR04083 family peptide-modifying radical SAM enzyme [Methanomicrobiales archaeon]
MKNAFHVMLIPTLGCPARCSYCWSSEPGSPIMRVETVYEVVEWLKNFRDDRVTFTFHGGEPLLAGADFYREALPLLSDGLAHMKPEFAMQTNLWLLTPEIADILAKYHVPLGTSIDGPRELNDLQRGEGYFDRTMKGYELAKAHGLKVSFICTFTSHSVKHKEEIFNFFKDHRFTLKLHPALPSLRTNTPHLWTLDPGEYGDLLVYLLDQYLEHIGEIEIMNINDLCRCVFTRRGSVCTFVDCMGSTFAIGPDGAIYPCYRFVGMPDFVMGNVEDHPTMDDLSKSPAWKFMQHYLDIVEQACGECSHIRYCRGGCPYNAIVPTDGKMHGVDPHCTAYRRVFDEISDRFNSELFGSSILEGGPLLGGPERAKRPGIMALMHRTMLR